MAPKLSLEKRLKARVDSEAEKRKKGAAELPKRKDKGEAVPSQPVKRIRLSTRASRGSMSSGTASGASELPGSTRERAEVARGVEQQPIAQITAPPTRQAEIAEVQIQPVTEGRSEPSLAPDSDIPSSSFSIHPRDTIERASTAALYLSSMFSERDLWRLGQMKSGNMDFISAASRHALELLLLMRGMEERRQSERDLCETWEKRAHKARDDCRSAEATTGKALEEMEKMKEEMRRLETRCKGLEVSLEQSMNKYNGVSNELAVVQNDLKLEKRQHAQALAELEVQVEIETRRKVELARGEAAVEAVESYKTSEAFMEAMEEAALPGVEMGMRFYRETLHEVYPNLDLSPLDEKYPQSVPAVEGGEVSVPATPITDLTLSMDELVEASADPTLAPEDGARIDVGRPEGSQPEVGSLVPDEAEGAPTFLRAESEVALPPIPEGEPEVPAPPPSD